jgi:transcriptional regulator with XRE-family HTH domain
MAGIGEKLRERALVLGLSDVEIARRVGLSQSRYANYVLGKREPDFGTLVKICRVLGTTPNFLLGFSEEAEAPSEAALIRKEIHRATLPMDVPTLQTAKTVVAALAEFGKNAPEAPALDPEAAEVAKHKADTLRLIRGIILSEPTHPSPRTQYFDIPRHAANPVLFRLWQNYEYSTPDESVMIADSAFYSWAFKLSQYYPHGSYPQNGKPLEEATGYWLLDWKTGPHYPHKKIVFMLERGGNCAEADPSNGRVTPGTWRVYNNRLVSITTHRDGQPFKTLIVNMKTEDGESQGYAITFPLSLLDSSACDFMAESVSCFSASHTAEPIGNDAMAAHELISGSGLLQKWGDA